MRAPILLMAVAALALAGCDRAVEKAVDKAVSEQAAAPGQEWTMQVVGSGNDEAVYLVTSPDGKTAAARIKSNVSTLIEDAEAKSFFAAAQAAQPTETLPEKVAISLPGVSINVSGDDNAEGGRGKVRINAGPVNIAVDGDNADGSSGAVRIGGVNADAAAKFIEGIDNLSPEVKQQMRDKLGLGAPS